MKTISFDINRIPVKFNGSKSIDMTSDSLSHQWFFVSVDRIFPKMRQGCLSLGVVSIPEHQRDNSALGWYTQSYIIDGGCRDSTGSRFGFLKTI